MDVFIRVDVNFDVYSTVKERSHCYKALLYGFDNAHLCFPICVFLSLLHLLRKQKNR